MKVLVTGAGGFLGQHIIEALQARGHSVRALIRPAAAEPNSSSPLEIIRADLRNVDNLMSAFDGMDAVIHAAAGTAGNEDAQFASSVIGTERFVKAMAQSRVKRLVLISSLVVYDWSRAKRELTEETSLESRLYDMGPYTIAKVWQERVVAQYASVHGWDLTIMRPGFLWGRGHAAIAGMGRHFGRIYLLFGPFTRLPLSHVINCADCIVTALECPAAIGETLNVIDDDQIRVWRYVREYAKGTQQPGFFVPIPYFVGLGLAQLASMASRLLFGKRGKLPSLLVPRRFEAQFKPIRFSTRKLRKTLAWRPLLSFRDCLASTYNVAEGGGKLASPDSLEVLPSRQLAEGLPGGRERPHLEQLDQGR